MSLLETIRRLVAEVPVDPIQQKYRGVSRLLPSAAIPRGQVYRLKPDHVICAFLDCDGRHGFIAMHPADVELMREAMQGLPAFIDIDQEIADACEQLIALRGEQKKT